MKQEMKVAEACRTVDNGNCRSDRQPKPTNRNLFGTINLSKKPSTSTNDSKLKTGTCGKSKKVTLCFHPACRSKSWRDTMEECDQKPDGLKKTLIRVLEKYSSSKTKREYGNKSGTKNNRRIN